LLSLVNKLEAVMREKLSGWWQPVSLVLVVITVAVVAILRGGVWKEFGLALLVGTVAAAIWSLLVWTYFRQRNRRQFEGLAGTYRMRRKSEDESAVGSLVTIKVRDRVLSLTSDENLTLGPLVGEVLMSQEIPNHGTGFYNHTAGIGWGFWELQVKDKDTLLVHTQWTNTSEQLVVTGWRMVREGG
jgi:signal transduction histidine kinase